MFHVIDDAAFVREMMITFLEKQGYQVKAFCNAIEYIAFVKSEEFKEPVCSFTDVNMPRMNGYEMIDVILNLKPELQFVLMTSELTIREEYLGKVSQHLAKPFRFAEVVQIVQEFHVPKTSVTQ